VPGKPDRALASMGIYVFSASFLYAELQRDHDDAASSHDFGKDIIPRLVAEGRAAAHPFEASCVKTTPEAEAYWRDVGTLDAYWAANLDLVSPVPSLDIYDPNWPIWTYQQQLPPAKFVFDDDDRRGMAVDSMVSGGCIISGARVSRSLLFSSCRINSHARASEAVLLPEVDVGRYARLTKVVVDRGCRIPDGLVIGEDPDEDARRFYRSERGVTLVSAEMLDALEQRAS
jgi:glucose-1-phosphate adenylyltransferase